MDLRTPREHGGPASAALLRPTDHARRAVRRAQLLLGLVAVVVAVPVGIAAGQGSPGPSSGRLSVSAELLEPAPAAETAVTGAAVPTPARWSTPDGATHTGRLWAEAGLARGAQVTATIDPSGRPVEPGSPAEDPSVTGLLAGTAVVVTCWVLLVLAGIAAHRRLAALDSRRWAAEWARVEPLWSGRA